jgi:hypothetical protein
MSDTALQPAARRLRPAYPFGFALLCFALMLYAAFEYIYMRGIPADRVNNADVAVKDVAVAFEWVSLAAGAWFIYLGKAAARTQVIGRFWLGVILYGLAALFLLFAGSVAANGGLC